MQDLRYRQYFVSQMCRLWMVTDLSVLSWPYFHVAYARSHMTLYAAENSTQPSSYSIIHISVRNENGR